MTREENLHWLNKEIQTWENECQSKHPIKEALYAAREALEQDKPMVEIDLYSVINQKYIEREVLDKIRAEIERLRPNLSPEQMTDYDYAMVDAVNDIGTILDKYKTESEAEE